MIELLVMTLFGCGENDADSVEKNSVGEQCEQIPQTELRRMTELQYLNSVRDILGVEVEENLFPGRSNSAGFRTWSGANRVSSAGAESIMWAAEYVASATDWREMTNCEEGEIETSCAERFLLSFGEKAFRRPLSGLEKESLLAHLSMGLGTDDGVQMAIELTLQSPYFLYIDGTNSMGSPDHAIASRLSYFLSNSSPDHILTELADRGELNRRKQVHSQAVRLLKKSESVETVRAFHQDWLGTENIENLFKDPDVYPYFGPMTAEAMIKEQDLFISEILWLEDPRFETLMFSDKTWINSELSEIYGLEDPGPGWRIANLDPDRRPGILTRSAFLSGHASSAASSPVRRGAFILEELLCESLSPPADVDMEIPPPDGDVQTIRERLAMHSADPMCAACHNRMDDVGFAFEHFGALGEWRDRWGEIPVDASGELEMGAFDNATELISLLGTSPKAMRCYTEKWYEYAIGRPISEADRCQIEIIATRFEESGGDIPSLLADISVTDTFLRPLREQ